MASSKLKLSTFSGSTLQGLFDNLPFPVSFAELDENPPRVAYINPEFKRVFGYALEDITSVQVWAEKAYPDPGYREQVMSQWEQDVAHAYAQGESVAIRQVTIQAKDGTPITTMLNGSFVGSSLVVAFIDISRQVRAESELKTVRSELQKVAYELVEHLPVGTYTMVLPPNGELGHFEFLSPRFMEITGLSREMIMADPLIAFSCIHPDDYDDWLALNQVAFANKTPFFGEARLCTHPETRWIQAESQPRSLDDGSVVWEGVIMDITERKRVEESLREAREKAERLERIRADFLTRMSHEIRTPLTMILGLTELLSAECPMPSQREKIQQLERSGEHLLGIVNDILDLSKIEAGQLITEQLPFKLSQLVSHIQSFAAIVNASEVDFQIVTEPLGDPVLYGDRRRIEQILGNLVNNAVKFTQQGTIKVHLALVDLDAETIQLTCQVIDSGMGIPKHLVNHLFTPFMQGHDVVKHELGGTGLGLSISKELITLMAGEIGVESRYGEGSRFWFSLPLLKSLDHPVSGQEMRSDEDGLGLDFNLDAQSLLRGLHILVVDDSQTICQLVKAFLEREGAQVSLAENGLNALTLVQQSRVAFDCMLVDLQMPYMDGLGFVGALRHRADMAHIPILAMTAGILAEQQVRARKAGMVDVITKPIDSTLMIRQIFKAVHSYKRKYNPRALSQNNIPEIDGIDRFHAYQTLDGDLEIFKVLATVFTEEYTNTLVQLRQLLTAQSSDQARQQAWRLAHSLQGSAAQIGALNVANMAALLDEALLQKHPKIDELIDELEAELTPVLAALNHYLQQIEPVNGSNRPS